MRDNPYGVSKRGAEDHLLALQAETVSIFLDCQISLVSGVARIIIQRLRLFAITPLMSCP